VEIGEGKSAMIARGDSLLLLGTGRFYTVLCTIYPKTCVYSIVFLGGNVKNSVRRMPTTLLKCIGSVVLLATVLSVLVWHTGSVSAASKSQLHILPGHAMRVSKKFRSIHATDTTKQLQLSISLNLRNRANLDALIASQDDPQSALYHHYLTPQQFKNAFGPTQATVNRVVTYLQGQGLHVVSVAPNNMLVNVSGSVATIEHAFGVTLNDYALHDRVAYAPANDPSIPDTLNDAIVDIEGLDNLTSYHHNPITHHSRQAAAPASGYTPAQLRSAYDVNTLMNNSGTGAGQTVALFELDGYKPSDVDTYLNAYHLGTPKYSNVLVDGATNTPTSQSVEVELDMEVMSAIAPDAAQKIYIAPNTESGSNDLYNRIVTDDQAKVISSSWGLCEFSLGAPELITLDNIFVQGAAQGQAFFAASGDAGAYDCRDGTTLAVDSPASDPHVVGVGGTSLQTDSNGSYVNESAWSDPSRGTGGGGGVSAFFTRPAYQKGPNLTKLNREVPDVSADADPATGYSIYCTVDNPICASGWTVVGGTSAAAPLWAALATDTNEYLAHQGKPGLGSVSASLYALYTKPQPYNPYHDVTTGNNLYYQATKGYDLATGVGSPDAWNFARDESMLVPSGNTGTMQLLKNPNFDLAAQSWMESASGAYEIVTNTKPHAGGFSADFCAYANCHDRLWQTVTLPTSSKKIMLSYWAYVNSQKTGGTCIDTLSISLRNTRGNALVTPQVFCNTQAAGWNKYTFDVTSTLSGYGGQNITLDFRGRTTDVTATEFFVDDVSLMVTSR
jgi:kumamolisin